MYRAGHIGLAGLFATLPVFVLFKSGQYIAGILFLIFTVGVCTLPDRVEDVFSLSHRGITHTVVFAIAMSVGLAGVACYTLTREALSFLTIPGDGILVGLAVFTGILSHLAGDILTKGYDYCVTPWWPVNSNTYQLHWVKSGNAKWNYSLLVAGVTANVIVVLLFLPS